MSYNLNWGLPNINEKEPTSQIGIQDYQYNLGYKGGGNPDSGGSWIRGWFDLDKVPSYNGHTNVSKLQPSHYQTYYYIRCKS